MSEKEYKIVDLVLLETVIDMSMYPRIEPLMFKSSLVKVKETQRQFELANGETLKRSQLCRAISTNRFYPNDHAYCRPGDEEKSKAALIEAIARHADKMIHRFEHLKLQISSGSVILSEKEYDKKVAMIEIELD